MSALVAGTEQSTPETRITAALALRVYQKILARADRQKQPPASQGITARVLFHNRVAIDTPSSRSLMRFRRRLADIDVGELG